MEGVGEREGGGGREGWREGVGEREGGRKAGSGAGREGGRSESSITATTGIVALSIITPT